jgi:hypothetical protein
MTAYTSHQERAEALKPLVAKLPDVNRQTLKCLMGLCANITEHVDKNKMTASNLATVLGPNLLYKKEINPLMMKTEMERGNDVIETIIDQYHFVFNLVIPFIQSLALGSFLCSLRQLNNADKQP